MEVVRYLERRFSQHLHTLAAQQFPILETVEFTYGKLDCTDILTLNKLVKGGQLEEFYWEAAWSGGISPHGFYGITARRSGQFSHWSPVHCGLEDISHRDRSGNSTIPGISCLPERANAVDVRTNPVLRLLVWVQQWQRSLQITNGAILVA